MLIARRASVKERMAIKLLKLWNTTISNAVGAAFCSFRDLSKIRTVNGVYYRDRIGGLRKWIERKSEISARGLLLCRGAATDIDKSPAEPSECN